MAKREKSFAVFLDGESYVVEITKKSTLVNGKDLGPVMDTAARMLFGNIEKGKK